MFSYFKRYMKSIFWSALLLFLVWGGLIVCRVNTSNLLSNIPRGIKLLRYMLPPDWSALPSMVGPALETVQIAFVGTVIGAALAFALSLPAASNLTPYTALREFARGIMSAERALPDLLIILFFVAIVGLGPFPGVMAVAVSSVGMLGKLFADAIEEVDPRPLEAMETVGATWLQMVRYAVLPQIIPSVIASTLYRFDVNIRMSIFLGVVGAGGIGFNLINSMRLLRYQETMAAIMVVLVLVVACEKTSEFLRSRVLGQEVLK